MYRGSRRGIVYTEGSGRFQYTFAIFLAKLEGHSAVVELLETYRQWTGDDWDILLDLEEEHEKDHVGYYAGVIIRRG